MPASSTVGKDIIKAWFESRTDIKTIFDVGAGEGTYPKLLGPNYRWIGSEIWAPYVSRFDLESLYSMLIIGDIALMKLPEADCIILAMLSST